MKVLVACEFSGTVRDAFIAKGHDAISCDLLPTESPGPHYQGDVFDVINDGFDLMIAHPPCTFLTCSAEWAYKERREIKKNLSPGKLFGAERKAAREDAVEFFMRLVNADIDKIAIENPVGVISSRYRRPDQWIHPHKFGHDASKKTGLWLKNLPLLCDTKTIDPRMVSDLPRWANQTDSGQNRVPPGKNQWKIRSIFYHGWANAMADQWNME